MHKYFRPFLLISSLLFATSAFASNNYWQLVSDTTVNIVIEGRIEINPKPSFVDIVEKEGQVNIAYTVVSNINFADMLADTAYQNANSRYKQGKTTILPVKNYYKKYGSFTTDVLSTKDKDLMDLLAQLYHSAIQESGSNKENEQRHLLDGTNVYLIETTSTGTRQVQAESPDGKSYPFIQRILSKCRDIYTQGYPDKTVFW